MDPGYAAVHAEQDRGHWWFIGRRAILLAEMARWLPRRRCRVAELGCGSGGLLEALGRFGSAVGVEADPALLETARQRGLDCRLGSLPSDVPLPSGEWDAVCLFDVLEHLDDESAGLLVERVSYFNALLAAPIIAVRLLRRALRRDGHDLSRPPAPLNHLLAAVFSAESRLLRRRSLPFGVSLLLVARRIQ